PLISELFTGTKSSLAAPWFDRYTTPLAILLVLFTGIGPLLAWRRVSWASARRVFIGPAIAAAAIAVALVAFTDAAQQPWALALFAFAGFALVGLAQEFWRGAAAQRSLSGGSMPAALLTIVSRNRRRYGGYVVHIGVAVLLIGIAASSSFQTKRDVELAPGQSAVIDGRTVTYVRPTAEVDKLAFTAGAVLRVQGDGEEFTLRPTRRFYRPTGGTAPTIFGYFAGESDSEVGLKAGIGNDFWTANRPDMFGVQRRARAADAGFRKCVAGGPGTPPQCGAVGGLMRAALANPSLRPTALAQIEALQLATARRIADGYVAEARPATFRVIVNPLVTWIWIGGLIALSGALIALWPSRRGARPLVTRDAELEALKEAKYREIRDAELDHAAGKLSDEDFALLDAELRGEAVELLDRANGNGRPRERETV
ncbi:MAG TPA: cytochrome c-type biogenesis CcmF C-terminal domain-containing protein, partial [Solirubrobacterales bacterium]|nr:cytochrome c-type biogenesis CcmF C-terminal domain-containing protein [Solirubrobacterales bacterium]